MIKRLFIYPLKTAPVFSFIFLLLLSVAVHAQTTVNINCNTTAYGAGAVTTANVKSDPGSGNITLSTSTSGFAVFNLSSIPAGASISAASITVYSVRGGAGTNTCNTTGITSDISGSSGSAENTAIMGGTSLSTVAYSTTTTVASKTIAFGSVAFLQSNIGGSVSVGFYITGAGTRTYTIAGETSANPPQLSITYTVPCSGTLTGTGISPASSALTFCGTAASQTLSVTGQNATGLTYQWQSSADSATFAPISGATNATYATGSISATTFYRVVVTCPASLSKDSATVKATINAVPTVTATPATATLCSGTSDTLTASGAVTYTWSPSATLNTSTGPTVIATPTAATTTYTVTGTAANGCTNTATSVITLINAPVLSSLASPANVCTNGSTQLVTSAGIVGVDYTVASATYNAITQTNPTTLPSTDDGSVAVPFPFTFNFYGINYTSVNICSNGFINFSTITQSNNYTPYTLPSTLAPKGLVALFLQDLSTLSGTSGGGTITYSTEGTAPFRKFVVSYNNVWNYCYSCTSPTNGTQTGQVILNETYNTIDYEITSSSSSTRTTGIQNVPRTLGTGVPNENNATYSVTTPEAWHFSPPVFNYAWAPATNLSNTNQAFDTASNLTATTVYSVTASYPGSSCATTVYDTVKVNSRGTWLGTGSSDYGTASNWSCGMIPTATDSILITAVTNQPVISSGNYNGSMLKLAPTTSLSIAGGSSLSIAGNIIDSGSVKGAGTLILSGTIAQTISGNGTDSNMTLNNAAGTTIASGNTLGIKGTLTIAAGTLTTNGGLILISSANGTGRIGTITGGAISGNVTAQQYVPGGRRAFRFLGHPFSSSIALSQLENNIDITGNSGSANGFTTTQNNNPSAFWYNPLTGNSSTTNDTGWTAFTSANGMGSNAWNPLEGIRVLVRGSQGQGLNGAAYMPSPATFSMTGAINQGPVTATLTVGANSGYNLLSNPYPSPTDIGTVIQNGAASLSGSGYYVWDANQQTAGAYVIKPITGGVYSIPANTSFFVNAAASGNTLSFTESNKTATTTSPLLKSAQNNKYVILNLSDSTGNSWDDVYYDFNSTANAGVENLDARKLHNTALDFYSYSSDNQKLSIDARPFVSGEVVPLGITTSVPQQFTITVKSYAVPAGGQLFLHDKYLGVYQPLSQDATYTFAITSDAASQGDNRFELGMSGGATAVSNIANNGRLDMAMTPNPANQQVTIAFTNTKAQPATLSIFSVTGQKLITKNLGNTAKGSVTVSLDNLAAGMYMVELNCGDNLITKKLIKQ